MTTTTLSARNLRKVPPTKCTRERETSRNLSCGRFMPISTRAVSWKRSLLSPSMPARTCVPTSPATGWTAPQTMLTKLAPRFSAASSKQNFETSLALNQIPLREGTKSAKLFLPCRFSLLAMQTERSICPTARSSDCRLPYTPMGTSMRPRSRISMRSARCMRSSSQRMLHQKPQANCRKNCSSI